MPFPPRGDRREPLVPSQVDAAPPTKPRGNTKAAGNRAEANVQAWLEAAGFAVEKARPVYVGKNKVSDYDFYGAFDLIARKRDLPIVWVQVTLEKSAWAKKWRPVEALYWLTPGVDLPLVVQWNRPEKPAQPPTATVQSYWRRVSTTVASPDALLHFIQSQAEEAESQ